MSTPWASISLSEQMRVTYLTDAWLVEGTGRLASAGLNSVPINAAF